MIVQLSRYSRPIDYSELAELLENQSAITKEAINGEVDLGPFISEFERLRSELANGSLGSVTDLDQHLVGVLHGSMSHINHRTACDMRMWHWLCLGPLKDFVMERWFRNDNMEELTKSKAGRLLGSQTLNGMSRNALARLYWCGEQLYSDEDGYRLAEAVFEKQDFFQAIFERELGNYRPAAKACAKVLEGTPEETFRNVILRLNYQLSTIVLEAMQEEQLVELAAELKKNYEESSVA